MKSSYNLSCGLAAIVALTATGIFANAEEAPIKIGQIEDSSGALAAAGLPKVHGLALAVDEINAKGGVLGRKLQVIYYDGQSDNTRYQEFARRAIQQDKVDVLFAGLTSASREAVRPVVDRYKQLYFYTNEYEGGVCDKNVFVTGVVPEQVLSPFLPWMMEKFGKRVYTIAADYNFGQISAEWIRQIVKENHGEMVGEEFIPLAVSQFSQTISNIQAAKPDFLATLMVGSNQVSFFEQAAAAQLKTPMASFVNGPVFFEHKVFQPPTFNNMYIAANYMEEFDTPANKDFVKRWRAKYPDEKYINQVGENAYLSAFLYAKGVELAKTTKQDAVIAALEGNDVCIDAPEGHICVEPKSHHVSHSVSLMEVQPDHSVKQLKVWSNVQPYWLSKSGCDLPKSADYSQYTPSNPPKSK